MRGIRLSALGVRLSLSRAGDAVRGSSLIEVLIALGLLAVLLVSMASLVTVTRSVSADARRRTLALALARERLGQLERLDFAREPLAAGIVDVTDTVTDLSGATPTLGGSGLLASPETTLTRAHAGYVDYLDAHGRWVGRDAAGNRRAAFVRRWRIERLGSGAGELAAVDVLVAPAVLVARVPGEDLPAHAEVVRLASVRARRAR